MSERKNNPCPAKDRGAELDDQLAMAYLKAVFGEDVKAGADEESQMTDDER